MDLSAAKSNQTRRGIAKPLAYACFLVASALLLGSVFAGTMTKSQLINQVAVHGPALGVHR